MASISKGKNGHRTIQFVASDGRRRSIRLGKATQRIADNFKVRVEALNAAIISGQPVDAETARWIAGLDDVMRDKLARAGLIPKHDHGPGTLAAFVDDYIAGRCDVKPNTLIVWRQTRRCLIDYFDADRELRSITPGDADAWRLWLWLIGQGLAENTVRRRCGFAKQFLRAALRKKLIPENPFADMQGTTVRGNRERDYFVTREEADVVLSACPDAQWRLLFALSRYGGLRCPSEHLTLRWGDVDWEKGRLTITSPKTEHHAGGGSRVIPIFPELRTHLEAAWDAAPEGAEFVISRYRASNSNLRTQLLRIIKRAGLNPWPRLFHNLRATRQTELAAHFPVHVVCEWLGNSKLIAQEHYLRVTEADYDRANETACGALHNPVQSVTAEPRNEPQPVNSPSKKSPDLQGFAIPCDTMQ